MLHFYLGSFRFLSVLFGFLWLILVFLLFRIPALTVEQLPHLIPEQIPALTCQQIPALTVRRCFPFFCCFSDRSIVFQFTCKLLFLFLFLFLETPVIELFWKLFLFAWINFIFYLLSRWKPIWITWSLNPMNFVLGYKSLWLIRNPTRCW